MPVKQLDYPKTVEKIQSLLRGYIVKNQIGSLVGGISGGVDSALVFALAYPVCLDLGIKLIGRSLTIESNKEDEITRAKAIGEAFCTDFAEEDLTSNFVAMYEGSVMDSGDKIDRGNAKARLRMIRLYGLARQNRGLVLSTDNLTEFLLAFWTLHGDVGDLGMIQNLWKTQVYDMTESIANSGISTNAKNALMSCVSADATDGLGISDTDLDQILPGWRDRHTTCRSGYKEVDERLEAWIKRKADPCFPKTVITHDPIINRNKCTEGKRNSPVNFKIEDIAVYA